MIGSARGWRGLVMAAIVATALGSAACTPGERGGRTGLLLAQAQFGSGNTPGAAKLSLLRPPARRGEPWTEEVITDPESNVFHKAIAYERSPGNPGILTIGAAKARLVFWTRRGDGWSGQTLWEGSFGGEWDRLRDMEIGDVTGDGRPEIVVATHDQGVVLVFERKGDGVEAREIDRKADTFVHEIELGDVDGDGTLEIFATPSARNVSGAEEQPGDVVMYRYQGGKFTKSLIEHYTTRHVKEILWGSLREGDRTLFAAVEGEKAMAGGGGAPSLLRVYRYEGDRFQGSDVCTLPGTLCRFLNMGDTDGDGRKELIASTAKEGIWKIRRQDEGWSRTQIVPGGVSSGFEHATILLDLDGDGADEIYVASDEQDQVNRFLYDQGKDRYVRELLRAMKLDFTWNIMPWPEGF